MPGSGFRHIIIKGQRPVVKSIVGGLPLEGNSPLRWTNCEFCQLFALPRPGKTRSWARRSGFFRPYDRLVEASNHQPGAPARASPDHCRRFGLYASNHGKHTHKSRCSVATLAGCGRQRRHCFSSGCRRGLRAGGTERALGHAVRPQSGFWPLLS